MAIKYKKGDIIMLPRFFYDAPVFYFGRITAVDEDALSVENLARGERVELGNLEGYCKTLMNQYKFSEAGVRKVLLGRWVRDLNSGKEGQITYFAVKEICGEEEWLICINGRQITADEFFHNHVFLEDDYPCSELPMFNIGLGVRHGE